MTESRPPRGLLVACMMILVLVPGCSKEPDRGGDTPLPTTNVVLISIDTLRPDHLGCYGYTAPTSPNLDRFCEESVVFRQAIAHAPSTLHSHASIFSSMLPHHHGASWGAKTRLPEEALTIAELLQSVGYSTAAFAGGGQMDRVFGLDQGFDLWDQPGQERFLGTVRHALQWLDRTPQRPFFLFLHSYEVHHPYTPSPEHLALLSKDYSGPLSDEISIEFLRDVNSGEVELGAGDLAHIIDAYDAEIRSVDDGFGLLVAALEERGLYEDTLIVFTSDHGEEFGEHGVVGWHSHSLFDELLRVPLVVRFPAGAHGGTVVEKQVRSIDIAPTVAGILDLPVPAEFDGIDLSGLVSGSDLEPLVSIGRIDRPRGVERTSVRTERWKMLLPRKYLYDLQQDPVEQWDAALSQRETVERLEQILDEQLSGRQPLAAEQVVPSDATLEELRALGYLN